MTVMDVAQSTWGAPIIGVACFVFIAVMFHRDGRS